MSFETIACIVAEYTDYKTFCNLLCTNFNVLQDIKHLHGVKIENKFMEILSIPPHVFFKHVATRQDRWHDLYKTITVKRLLYYIIDQRTTMEDPPLESLMKTTQYMVDVSDRKQVTKDIIRYLIIHNGYLIVKARNRIM